MSNDIVQVLVSVLASPAPNTLQKTGALVSQGATTLAPGTSSLLTQAADLTPLLQGAEPLASLTWSGGLVTATMANTTVASGTYNGATGLVTLTLTAGIDLSPGDLVNVPVLTGTGSFAQAEGTFVCGAGTAGTTLTYTIATGLTMTITGGTASATTGQANGATFTTTIAGDSVAGYNGTFAATVTSADTFTYPLAANPGASGGAPTYTPFGVGELTAMVTTYFNEGASVGVYVLELGPGTPAAGVTALAAYILAPALRFYRYLLPLLWATEPTAYALAAQYTSNTAEVYFHPTLTLANFTPWKPALKAVVAWVQSTAAPLTEFGAAGLFEALLANDPSSTHKLLPTSYRFLFGVTQLNPSATDAATLKANFLNYADAASEGGLSNTIVKLGVDMSGLDCSFWYSGDWMAIGVKEDLAAAVIEGSNDPVNPLYYDQPGINRLQGVAQGRANRGLSYGVATGTPTVTAVPFVAYVTANPTDFPAGIYRGFALAFTPAKGFENIVFNLTVSQLAPGQAVV